MAGLGQGGSHVPSDISSDIRRLLQLREEEEDGEDDATSKLAELQPPNRKPETDMAENDVQMLRGGETDERHEDYYVNQDPSEHGFHEVGECKSTVYVGMHHAPVDSTEASTLLDYQQLYLHQESPHGLFLGFDATHQHRGDVAQHISDLVPAICPPASAFLRPKCALWDCPRPAMGTDWFQDYCGSIHAVLALNEGPPGMSPVLRPGGIDLKDGPLFSAISAKTQGKNVGIPECEGAATTKSPWNAPELFDLSVLEGESIREWLFFDKPRRAFESGNRKQRSLPDYNGRGWHESRKQVMKDFGGLKRSYYMDPQPLSNIEWHLYEYEINSCDAFALYRLEFKFIESKKSPKGKVSGDSFVDLQRQLGRLNAEYPMDSKRSVKSRSKANLNDSAGSVYTALPSLSLTENGGNVYPAPDQVASVNEIICYGPRVPYAYSAESLNDHYGT